MALPPYTSKDELDASGAPVVPLEPVAAVAPNRGTENVASSLDYLAALQRVHQTLSFGTAPRMEWDDASRVLTLGGDLVVRYVVDDPTSTLPLIRSTTLKRGSYSFGTNTMVFIPLGFDADVEITAGGTVVPPSEGSLAYFKDDGEAQQFFRADTSSKGRQNALKYIQFGRKAGTSLQVLGRVVLRNGAPVEDFRDEEYAGDTVTQQTRRFINQDRNLMMYGAGIATFSTAGAGTRSIQTVSNLELITANGTRTTVTGLVAGVSLTTTNPVLAVSLNRTLLASVGNPAIATNFSALSSDRTDLTMLVFWDEVQDVFRWRDGSGYKPGTAHTIGLCCDFTPSFLIERILPELVFATDAAANTFLGGIGATNRVVMVVDDGPNAPRDQIRFATQDSINVGLAQETIRVYGISQQRIFATDASVAGPDVVKVRDAGDAADGSMFMESAHVNTLRNRGGSASGDLEVQNAAGSALDNLKAAVLRADTRVETDVIRPISPFSAQVSIQRWDGSATALLEVSIVKTGSVYCDNALEGALMIRDASSPSDLFPIEASQGLFEEFVRVDGTGLSEPQVRASGSEVAFRDAAGGPVVDVRAKDVRAHDLRLFDDPTVPGSSGDVRVQVESPNSAVAGENAVVLSSTSVGGVCVRVSQLGGSGWDGAVEVANLRIPNPGVGSFSYVRVANHTNTDERDIWARGLYLNSGAGAGAVYFDTPAAPSPNRLSASADLLYWANPADELRDFAVRRAYFADPAAPTTAPTILSSEPAGDRLSLYPVSGTSFPLDVSSVCLRGTTAAGTDVAELSAGTGGYSGARNYVDVREKGGASDPALVRAWGVASSNSPVLVGCITYAGGWKVDGLAPLTVDGAYRPIQINEVTLGGSPDAIQVVATADQNFGGLGDFSWHVTAQYDDGSLEPAHATLVAVGNALTGTNNALTFQFYELSGALITTAANLRDVTFNVSVYTRTYTV